MATKRYRRDLKELELRRRKGMRMLAGAVANGFPTELWTLARVAKWVKREFGVAYSTVNVWRILRELGFSSQRPAVPSSATKRRSNSGAASAGRR